LLWTFLVRSGFPQLRAAMGSALFRSPSPRIPNAYIANDSRFRQSFKRPEILPKYSLSRLLAAESISYDMPPRRTKLAEWKGFGQ